MKKFPFTQVRALVAAAIVALMAIGLVSHAATGTWSALGVESIAAICPVGALEVMLGSREFLLHPFVLLLAAAVGTWIVGKAFCAWACPVPWLQRLFRPERKAPSKNSKDAGQANLTGAAQLQPPDAAAEAPLAADHAHGNHQCGGCASCCTKLSSQVGAACPSQALPPVGGKRNGLQLDTRHFTLIGALGSAALFGFPVFCLVCPIGLTVATFVGVLHLLQFNETSWGLVVFPLLLLAEVVLFRKWCAKICPISALLSLVSASNRTLRPRVDESACLRTQGIDCHACVTACPEQLDPHGRSIPECIKRGACAVACPANAIHLSALGRLKSKNRS